MHFFFKLTLSWSVKRFYYGSTCFGDSKHWTSRQSIILFVLSDAKRSSISKQYIWIPFVYIISSSSLAITLAFIEKTLNRMSCTLIQHLSVVLSMTQFPQQQQIKNCFFPMRMCNLHVLGALKDPKISQLKQRYIVLKWIFGLILGGSPPSPALRN